MTDREILVHAKEYIDKMAAGINPLDGTKVCEDDLINNVRISRCLYFVSNVLQQVLNGDANKLIALEKFRIDDGKLEKFAYSEIPIPISEITKRVNDLIDTENMNKLSYVPLMDYLLVNGYVEIETDENGKNRKTPTEKGKSLGIHEVVKQGKYGPYRLVVYPLEVQHMLIKNLTEILNEHTQKIRSAAYAGV